MSSSTKRNRRAKREVKRAYRPKPVHANAIERAITGAQLLPRSEVAALNAALDHALVTFGRGIDCLQQWRVMADAANVAEGLARVGIASDEESKARIWAGKNALGDVYERAQANGCWTLRAAEREAIDTCIFIHQAQLTHCSWREYESAVADVRNRVTQAQRGNAPVGARVLTGDIA